MTWMRLMATSKKDIKDKITWAEKQAKQPTIEKSLKLADEKYSIKEISQEHFEDEGK